MKVNLPGLHGGISQQAAALRMMNQHTDVNNVVCDVVDGLRFPRPGTTRVTAGFSTSDEGILGTVRTTDGYLWVIYRLYEAGVTDFIVLQKFDSDYSLLTTQYIDVIANDYLKKSAGRLRLVNVLDTLFLVNCDVTVNVSQVITSGSAADINKPYAIVHTPTAYETFGFSVTLELVTTVATTEFPSVGTSIDKIFGTGVVAAGVTDPSVVIGQVVAALSGTHSYAVQAGSLGFITPDSARVTHGGNLYLALSTHTAEAANEPGVGASWTTYWSDLGAAPGTGDYDAWALGTRYNYGQDLIDARVEVRLTVNPTSSAHPLTVYSAVNETDPLSGNPYYVTTAPSYEQLPPFIPPVNTLFSGAVDMSNRIVFKLGDHYFVKFNATSASYEEVVAPGQAYKLVGTTMPHKIVYNGATWSLLSTGDWEDYPRSVGDNSSSPLPDFVGRSITDMFYYRDRLCFVSDNFVSMSRVRDYYNFFPQTATEVLDNDPISVAPSSTAYFKIEWVKASGRQLVLLARERQYVLHSGYEALTPKTVVIDEVTNFQLANIEPLLMEESLLLATDSGSYVGAMEYKVMDQEVPTYGVKLSESIPRLIPSNYTNMVYAAGHELILIWKPGTPVVYTYKFHKKPDGALTQVAWTQWTMPSNVVSIVATESDKLLILVEGNSSLLLMDLTEREGVPLDDREYISTSAASLAVSGEQIVVDVSTYKQWESSGGLAKNPDPSVSTAVVRGLPIVGYVELSPFIPRDDNGLPRTDIATTIQSVEINWEGGELEVDIARRGLPTYTVRLTPEEYTEEECGEGQYYREPRPTRALVMFPAGRTTITLNHVGTRYTSVNNFAYNVHFTKDRA